MKKRVDRLKQEYVDACSRYGQAELDMLVLKGEAMRAREALALAIKEEADEDKDS